MRKRIEKVTTKKVKRPHIGTRNIYLNREHAELFEKESKEGFDLAYQKEMQSKLKNP